MGSRPQIQETRDSSVGRGTCGTAATARFAGVYRLHRVLGSGTGQIARSPGMDAVAGRTIAAVEISTGGRAAGSPPGRFGAGRTGQERYRRFGEPDRASRGDR